MAAPFLTDFQNSMTQLTNMRGQIEGKLQFNAEFNRTLSEKLNSIKTLVQQLSDKIRALKENITRMQTNVDKNAGDMRAKESEIERLQNELQEREDRLRKMQSEKTAMEQLVNEGEKAKNSIQNYEKRIQELERQLAEVQNNSNNQKGELQNQMRIIADLQRQLNECNKQKEELNNRIREGDAAKAELASYKSKEAGFSKENNDMKTQIANLNAQIAGLTKNNQFYKDQIIAATNMLNTSMGYLNQFINSPPNQATLDELNNIVNDITQLISQISVVLDGNPTATPPLAPQPVTGASSSTAPAFVPSNRLSSYRIKRKQEQDNINPYKGGKKSTKRTAKKRKSNKYNKQKGGFTYKMHSQRRSVPTSSRSSIQFSPMSSTRTLSDSARGRKRRGKTSRARK